MNLVTFMVIGVLTSWIASKLVEEYVLGELGGFFLGTLGAFAGVITGKILFNLLGEASFGMADLVGFSAVGAIVMITFSSRFYRSLQTQ